VCFETITTGKKERKKAELQEKHKFLTTDIVFFSDNSPVTAEMLKGTIKYNPCASIHYGNIKLQTMTISNVQIPIHITP